MTISTSTNSTNQSTMHSSGENVENRILSSLPQRLLGEIKNILFSPTIVLDEKKQIICDQTDSWIRSLDEENQQEIRTHLKESGDAADVIKAFQNVFCVASSSPFVVNPQIVEYLDKLSVHNLSACSWPIHTELKVSYFLSRISIFSGWSINNPMDTESIRFKRDRLNSLIFEPYSVVSRRTHTALSTEALHIFFYGNAEQVANLFKKNIENLLKPKQVENILNTILQRWDDKEEALKRLRILSPHVKEMLISHLFDSINAARWEDVKMLGKSFPSISLQDAFSFSERLSQCARLDSIRLDLLRDFFIEIKDRIKPEAEAEAANQCIQTAINQSSILLNNIRNNDIETVKSHLDQGHVVLNMHLKEFIMRAVRNNYSDIISNLLIHKGREIPNDFRAMIAEEAFNLSNLEMADLILTSGDLDGSHRSNVIICCALNNRLDSLNRIFSRPSSCCHNLVFCLRLELGIPTVCPNDTKLICKL